MTATGEECHNCGDKLITRHGWDNMTIPQRHALREDGWQRKGQNGECDRCRQARTRRHHAASRERTWRTNAEALEDWEFLVDHTRSMRANIRLIAPRIGMSVKALEKALDRAGVRAWPAERSWVA